MTRVYAKNDNLDEDDIVEQKEDTADTVPLNTNNKKRKKLSKKKKEQRIILQDMAFFMEVQLNFGNY